MHRGLAARQAFDRAARQARDESPGAVPTAAHLLEAVLQYPDVPVAAALNEQGLAVPDAVIGQQAASVPGSSATPVLDELGRDLTALARAGKLEPVIGRRAEMRALARVLGQHRKRSALLIGDPGVGKTGVVEGIAALIASGNAPEALAGGRIVEISVAALTAGTMYRGQLEARVRAVVAEATATPTLILFIDEIHAAVSSSRKDNDVATILKPALARGEIRCIGATTIGEYHRDIENDPALERRFHVIEVDEPSRDEAVEILRGLRARFAAHYRQEIDDDALVAAVDLAVRYVPDRRLPDKAIDLVDQACARVRLATLTPGRPVTSTVARVHVAEALAERAGIPLERLTRDAAQQLLSMEQVLQARVVGQEAAVRAVATAVRTARAGLGNPRRPAGVFLFAGPTGTGKTELAKALAEFLFDDESRLIRIHMSEYQERHSVSRLLGAPPGYLGHDRDGQLTGPVRTHPYSVVLFDEIEKAHPDILDLLQQILDEGTLTDARGRQASFRECIVILTTNLGAADQGRRPLGFAAEEPRRDAEERRRRIGDAVRAALRPELVGRIGDPVVFDPLPPTQMRAIVLILLDRLRARMADRGFGLQVSERAVAWLARAGHDPARGARELERTVEQRVAQPAARIMLESDPNRTGVVQVDERGGELVVEYDGR